MSATATVHAIAKHQVVPRPASTPNVEDLVRAWQHFNSLMAGLRYERPSPEYAHVVEDPSPHAMTERQRKLLTELICKRCGEPEEREQRLNEMEGLNKYDASTFISSLLKG